jgi:hypothetical protein
MFVEHPESFNMFERSNMFVDGRRGCRQVSTELGPTSTCSKHVAYQRLVKCDTLPRRAMRLTCATAKATPTARRNEWNN